MAHHRQHNPKHQPLVETQPRLFSFTLKGLMNLPYRLCNPPPAVGKVRSCGLTPIFKVKLEDVLDRKHLPPLGLKDFEEWLLFVEQCPENLYFILWLRDYTAKYNHWAAKSKHTRSNIRLKHRAHEIESEIDNVEKGRSGRYRVNWPASTTVSPSLAMSYARAKQTFFAPNSSYALCVPPDLLSPFFRVNDDDGNSIHPGLDASFIYDEEEHVNKYFGSPHPDPEVFTDIALVVQARLNASLRNCVRAAYSNVGTFRATCGICAGIFITLATAFPPLLINFLHSQDRWLRLAAIPGLWLGLTVLCASLKGVCMMVYIFGDFRQLRKFELQRPPLPGEGVNAAVASAGYGLDSRNGTPLVRPPMSPPVALTAPPRMPISFPSRIPPTPSLTYSQANSYSFYSRPTSSSGASKSMMEGDTLHTISISSSRNPGGSARHDDDDASERTSISVPGCDSSDDGSSIGGHRGEHIPRGRQGDAARRQHRNDGTDDEDEEDEEDDCGIYISPAYQPPDELAELELIDPAAVEMVVAAAARAGMFTDSGNGHASQSGTTDGNTAATANHGCADKAEKAEELAAHPPPPTAAFIPPFEYFYDGNDKLVLAGVNLDGGIGEGGRALRKKEKDLEAGAGLGKPEMQEAIAVKAPSSIPLTVVKTSAPLAFDFDALPPVKRERVESCAEDSKTLLEKMSFLRTNGQHQLPTHIEAQVHVQIDSDAELDAVGSGTGGASVDDLHRRETVTSTTMTMMSQTNVTAPKVQPLSPTATFLNTNVTSLNDKSCNAPASPMLLSPASGHSGMTYLGSMTGDMKCAVTDVDEQNMKKKRSFRRLLLHLPSLSRQSNYSKPSGCNDFPSYTHHFTTSRKSKVISDTSSDDSWRGRFSATRHVPAFGPVTRVLNPVVTRAQWEIVVRAAALALVLSVGIMGALCAVPVQ